MTHPQAMISARSIDLRDLANRDGASVQFAAQFEAMRRRQIRRRGFFVRWKRENELKRS
jgi:hypothetical protein